MSTRPEDFRRDRDQRAQHYRTQGDQIRHNTRNHYQNLFTPDWHARYPYYAHHAYPWGHVSGHHWWHWSTWPVLTTWFVWSWGQPIYYDYGGNVYYYNDYVYIDNTPVCTGVQYAQQAEVLANRVPPVDPQPEDWLPLGVFAFSQGQDSEAMAYLQLAVTKDGAIGGTYHNVLTDTTLPIQGTVDQRTQRAAWTIGDNKTTVMETGVYNLTQDQTTVLVHYGDQQTKQWLLVRLQSPESAETDKP